MRNFLFWQKWLFVTAVVLTVFGAALALFNGTSLFDAFINDHIDPTFWAFPGPPADSVRFREWSYGVLGATVAGWGVMMALLVRRPFRNKEPWAWNAVALSVTLWFVVDTGLSLYHRVLFNVAFNTVLFAAIAAPLLFTKAEFNLKVRRT